MRHSIRTVGGTATAATGMVLLALGIAAVFRGGRLATIRNRTLAALGVGAVAVLALVSRFPKVTRDLTRHRRYVRALRDKNRELEAANRAKDRFLAGMSHELRTPLNAIIGFTGTMLMKLPGPLTTAQERQLRLVRSNARHLLSLINDLLDLARIGAGKVELRIEPVVFQDVVQEVTATLGVLAEAKGVALEVSVPEADVVLPTDRRALKQILINLVHNALKFTERGRVRVVLAERQVGGQRQVELRMEDTGRGIRAEDQPKLFEEFVRVQNPTAHPVEGTGLGLHLSQALAGLLGGRITVESQDGQGSTFILHLAEGAVTASTRGAQCGGTATSATACPPR